jgi:predicted nucleic acid-binding protein
MIVIDASLAMRAIWPIAPDSQAALNILERWHQQKTPIIAPDLWLPEVMSVIRQGVYRNVITEQEARQAVEDVFALGVEIVPSEEQICHDALTWAERLGHSKAYDGFYLALATAKGAPLWTADKRLVNGAHQVGISWVHCLEM